MTWRYAFILVASGLFGLLWSNLCTGFGVAPLDGIVSFLIWFVPLIVISFCMGRYGAEADIRDRERE